MSPLYTGVDLIEIERIERALARWGERFLQRVFTPAEREAYAGRVASLAARWAAKEATAKLLGVGVRGMAAGARAAAPVAWTEIEVLGDDQGCPQIRLYGGAAARAHSLGCSQISVSLSHTRHQAIAFVVAMASEEGAT